MALKMVQSNKLSTLRNKAADASESSDLKVYHHGSCLFKNGKPIASGFNHNRSYVRSVSCCSLHAEVHCCIQWLEATQRKNSRQSILRPSEKGKEV